MATSNRLQVRLNPKDQPVYQRGVEFHRWLNPHKEPTDSEVVRYALHATYAGNVLCPYCATPMDEKKDDEGGTLGIWVCPECSAGSGDVVVET